VREERQRELGWFSMSPLPRLHHDIMTIVGLFTYRQYVIYNIYIYTYRSYLRNVGVLKVADLHCSRQQCIVVEWSGRSVAVRVREWNFCLLFFFSVQKCEKKHCHGTVNI